MNNTNYDRIKNMTLAEMIEFFRGLVKTDIITTADHYICKKCKEEHNGECPMGDDDQCLYDASDYVTVKLWLTGDTDRAERTKTIVEELRAKPSRDNRNLLDRAADRIEELEALLGKELVAKGYCKIPDNIGEFSDGYHTFNELYHHRAVLFSVICNMFPERAWKSKLHDTGDMFDGMFIVGIETEQGQATYHYDIEPYWDMFKVKELDKAPKWDGHTPSDAIRRIGSISSKQSEVVKEFVKRFEKYIGNCTFTMGQTNDIQYALKKAAEEMKGGAE